VDQLDLDLLGDEPYEASVELATTYRGDRDDV
jgi:hypothetical protein